MMDADETVEILLAEDNDADAELLFRTLHQAHVINTVTRVRDGIEALDFICHEGDFAHRRGGVPKLLLLALKMPKVDGIDVIKRLAERGIPAFPVVLRVSSEQERGLAEAYDLNVSGYLVKPVEIAELTAFVAASGWHWIVMNRDGIAVNRSVADPPAARSRPGFGFISRMESH